MKTEGVTEDRKVNKEEERVRRGAAEETQDTVTGLPPSYCFVRYLAASD